MSTKAPKFATFVTAAVEDQAANAHCSQIFDKRRVNPHCVVSDLSLAARDARQNCLRRRGGSLTNAVAVARPVLQDVDVQVLGMRRIGPWAEYRCEPPACGDADGIDRATQMFIPIRFDGQCFAIRELEARDVHRQTGRVRANLAGLCAVAVAAFVTRSRVNRLEFDRELAGNERSDEIAQPMAEPFTELTGKRRLFG